MADSIIKFRIEPNLVVFGFSYKFLLLIVESW